MAPRPSLERLKLKPAPGDWGDDELVSLAEAAALYFPYGPMTANALRIAFRRGELAATEMCGKLYTTPRHVRAMMTPHVRQPEVTVAESEPEQLVEARSKILLPAALARRAAAARKRRRL
jgi:hypothetical protein